MCKYLIIIFFCCEVSIYSEKLTVIQDGNLRTEPSINSKVLDIAKTGDKLDGTSINENWYEINDSRGSKLYIHKSLVKSLDDQNTRNNPSDNDNKIPIFLLIVLAVILFIAVYGFKRRCPQCKKWFSRRIINIDTIDRKQYYKTIEREDIHKNANGEEIGRTKRKEQVHMIQDTDRVFCECKKCGHRWTYLSVSEREG